MTETPLKTTDKNKEQASAHYKDLRDRICARFEALETHYAANTPTASCHQDMNDIPVGRFNYTSWDREQDESGKRGGGTMGVMKGRVFEKVGVNISTVHGDFSDEFRAKIPGTQDSPKFWAAGISLVAHMRSPFVPPVHMNLRHISTAGKAWFGGGADLNPIYPNDDDTTVFHDAMKRACDKHNPDYYEIYKKACDDYFYIPHRKEHRGVGGLFVDYLDTGDWGTDFAFIKDIGEAFIDVFPQIVEEHMMKSWTPENRHHQKVRRGRYAEFNLLYDRGTIFGLKTGGKIDAILMSMPPEVIWE